MRKIIQTGWSARQAARAILAVLLVVLPVVAQAQVATVPGSNMPANFYPAPSCEKPDKKALGSSPGVQDQDAMRSYNLRIKKFNDKAAAFNTCIKRYVDNAQNDINAIQTIVHAAVADANAQQ
jgi:hypothetical protein